MEELLSKYFAGEASKTERNLVKSWRAESEENALSFLEAKSIWIATSQKDEPNAAILSSILFNDTTAGSPEIIPLWNQKIFRLAAAVVIGLGIVFALLKEEPSAAFGIVVEEMTVYELPDGSVATLKAGSSISIGEFDEIRDVRLSGKAFFEIKENKSKPFVVNTKAASITVLGTSFLVDAPSENGQVELMVKTGKVTFAQNPEIFGSNSLELSLEAGEKGIIKPGERGIKKQNLKNENYLGWKTKKISFKNATLSEVEILLGDVYDTQFSFELDGQSDCKLTANFYEKSSDDVASILAQTFNLELEKNPEGYLFTGEDCQ